MIESAATGIGILSISKTFIASQDRQLNSFSFQKIFKIVTYRLVLILYEWDGVYAQPMHTLHK